MDKKILSLKNVKICYGKNTILENVNFSVDQGDFACIVGANGSGKSTLVKTILGLLRLNSGKIWFRDGIRQSNIGFLPQEMKVDGNFPATVQEVVLSGTLGKAGPRFFYTKEDKEAGNRILERLNISGIKNKSFMELSGGQKQKVLLGRALVATKELLILDEPSNNLDQKSRQNFYQILKELNQDGLTILMITHDLDIDDLIGNKIVAITGRDVKIEDTASYLRSFR